MTQATRSALDVKAQRVNRITGSPDVGYDSTNQTFNVGHFFIEGAYGGVKLSRITTTGGCDRDVLGAGFVSKPRLADLMDAFIAGLTLKEQSHG